MHIVEQKNNIDAKIENLYIRYKQLMLIIAKSILRDTHLAEDAVQEAFIRIQKNINKITDVSCNETRGFVVIIVKNIALDMVRKERNQRQVSVNDYEYAIADDEPSVEDRILGAEDFDILSKGLYYLETKYKYPLLLRYYYGYSNRETGELLGMDENAVRMQCFRGRKILLKILRKGESAE